MNTDLSRTNKFGSVFLAALFSLLALSGLSLYIINAKGPIPVLNHSGLLFSNTTQWRVATPAENHAVNQSSTYLGTQTLQEMLPAPIATGVAKVNTVIKTGLHTGQKILAYSGAYPLNISALLLKELPIASAQASTVLHPVSALKPAAAAPESAASHLKFTSSEQRLTPKLYAQLQHIFKNEVYLNPHSERSQRFSLIYDHAGHILLAAVTVDHKTYQAVRYTDSTGHTGYYTPAGEALFKSAFLTAPVKYSRISDGFTMHRWHPILHIVRPHYGIDYAAPAGTPIRAVASGRVSFTGSEGGYGRAIVIRHDSRFQSLYAHLSRFAIRSGQWVSQGEIIGYVGSSGLATGPHLHFGLYEYGKPVNPALVLPKLKAPTRIAQRDLPDFIAKTNHLLIQLAWLQNHNLANG